MLKNKFASVAIFCFYSIFYSTIVISSELISISEPTSRLILSDEEKRWLAEHPRIRFAFPDSIPPYSMIDNDGKTVGFIHDWFQMLNAQAGTNIEIVSHDFQRLLSDLDKGLYDGIAGVTYSQNIKDDYIYTDEVVPASWSIYTHQSALSYSSFDQVKDKSFAIINGSLGEPVIRALYPRIKLTKYPSIFLALSAVENGDVFAMIGESRTLNYVVKRDRVYGVVENFTAHDLNIRTASKIRKDWKILADILNKAQELIPEEKKKLLEAKWLQPGVQISHLTLDEIKWLLEKKSVDINFYELPPYLLKTAQMEDGFLVDYFNLFEKRLGFEFNLKIIPRSQFPLNDDGSLPEAALTLPKEPYQEYYSYTKPFFTSLFGLFTRINAPVIEDLNSLNTHTVGVVKGGPPYQRRALLTRYKGIKVVTYDNTESMIDDLLLEEIDSVYAGASAMRSYLSSQFIQAIKLNWLDTKNIAKHSLSIRKDLSPLSEILSKSWSRIDKQSQARIFEKWLIKNNSAGRNNELAGEGGKDEDYTEDEKKWLKQHRVIYYSDISWVPYVSIDEDNNVSGIGKDYLDLISKDSGIEFKFIRSENWNDLIAKLKNNKIFLSLAAGKNHERTRFSEFSEPYISSPMSIVTSDKYSYVQNLEQLDGLTIAIPEGLFITDFIKDNYPKINLVYTDTILQSLEMVADNKADAFIGSMAVVGSHLRKAELYNLRVSGLINRELNIHFMIGKQHPELVSIINKSLKRIDEVQRRGIANRWFAVNFNTGVKSQTVFLILLIAVIVLSVSFYWIRRLKLEIEQKNLVQEALKSARVDAELANKAKSEFLANMSHEIRTPMNAIVGFSHLLSESELTEKQQSYLRSIRIGSDGLLHIINDILDLSKIEAGKMQIEYAPTDLVKLIEELEMLFQNGMREKGIEFKINIDLAVPRYVSIDANRVRQILLNIIGNAQKFTDFGKINLNVSSRTSKKSKESVDLNFEVTDTGIGIDENALELIFKHFEQNDRGNNQKYGGTGLGLAISRKLAEKMDGTLGASSKMGKGSSFKLQLYNVDLVKQFKTTNSEEKTYKFDDSVVLIVDDIESNRILLAKYLEKYPFELFIAENGKEAVELAIKVKPNLILMDLRMPELDGYEATKRIKKIQDTVVVALTASALEDEESKEKQKVFDDFLRKPILKSKLISTMAKFLNHQYKVKQQHEDLSWDLNITDNTSLSRFINKHFISDIVKAHKLGDVEKISLLAAQLEKESVTDGHDGFSLYAAELIIACQSFDVERIDYLVELFSSEVA